MTNSSVSPERKSAAIELLRRRSARATLLDFTRYTFPDYQAEPAHALIAETLDKVVSGSITRLMIFAPPQHGKSELASVRLPALWLGKRPDDPVILSSYAASLAETKSRQARQVVESPEYGNLFPGTATQTDARAISHWNLENHRGYLLAAGVGGPITGHGARLGIIDDPIENWQEAQSQTVRDTCWEWWRSTFRTRIWEGGAIILIMTRWHEDDLAGRLLQDQPGQWTVLRLTAVAETQDERDSSNQLLGLPSGEQDPLARAPGEPLCPGRFSLPALQALSRDVGSSGWAGQYQGVPKAPEGNRFKRNWFPVVDSAPYKARRVRYYDRAASEGHGDFTVGILMAHADGVFYIEDMVRGQWSSGARDAIIKETAERDAVRYNHTVQTWVEQEPGSSGKDSALAIIRLLAGHSIRADKVTGSKEVRADPFAAQAEAGNVRLVRGPWNGAYLDELTSFPNGAHDDIVDASSGAFAKLAGRGSVAGTCRSIPIRSNRSCLRIVVCTPDQLAGLSLDQKNLLVSIADPGKGGVPYSLDNCLGRLLLEFLDIDPADYQADWGQPIPPWGLPVEDLMFTRDTGRRLWSFLARRRDPYAEVFVFADDNARRVLSLVYATCDTLGLARSSTIHKAGAEDWKAGNKDPAPNPHVFGLAKASRAMVMGEIPTVSLPMDGSSWKPFASMF
jgi:predicted phage terminase large subunit-like protein